MNRTNAINTLTFIKYLIIFTLLLLNVNTVQGMSSNSYNDTLTIVIDKLGNLESDIAEISKWKNNQKDFADLTNQRISDNFSLLDRISTCTAIGLALITLIVTVMNVILFVWIFVVQRNLSRETREINAETKESQKEMERKSEEISHKTEQLFKQMLDSKFGDYNKKIRDEIVHEDEDKEFDKLNYENKHFRAEKELDEGDIRSAILHYESLLDENKNLDYIYNRIGIGYVKIGVSQRALFFFKKAYEAAKDNKRKYVLNLLERYIVLGMLDEALGIVDECEKLNLDEKSLPTFFVLKYALYVKLGHKKKLEVLKQQQENINWNINSKWEFKELRDCFTKRNANDFHYIFRFANIAQD